MFYVICVNYTDHMDYGISKDGRFLSVVDDQRKAVGFGLDLKKKSI